MKEIKSRIETVLEKSALIFFDHPLKTLIFVGLFVVFTLAFIPLLTVDVSTRGNFQKADEVLKKYTSFKKQFGTDTSVVIALHPKDVFDREFLLTLKRFQDELEEKVPYLDEVTSLLNITAIKSENNELIIEDLFEDWPETQTELDGIKNYVMNHPDYKYNIISEDGDYTLMLVRLAAFLAEGQDDFTTEQDIEQPADQSWSAVIKTFVQYMRNRSLSQGHPDEKLELTVKQNNEIVARIFEIAEKYESETFPFFITGGPVIEKLHVDVIGSTMRKTIGISVLAMFTILTIIFRRFVSIIVPLLIVILSLVSTFGIMPLLGIPLRTTSQIFPAMILTAGICDAVHLFSIFYQRFQRSGNKRDSIAQAMKHSGLAMFFTTLTTAGGFLSFAFSDLRGISEVGICAALGIVLALIYTYILVPVFVSLLSITPIAEKEKTESKKRWENYLEAGSGFAVANPLTILIPVCFLIVISAIGASKIEFSFNMITWFPPEMKVEANSLTVEKYFKTSTTLEVVVDTGVENGLFEPAVMNAIEQAQLDAESIITGPVTVGKTNSIVNSLKLINRVLNNNSASAYGVPQEKSLIAQEMILFENSGWDNLKEIVDRQFSKTRITIGVPTLNAVKYVNFRDEVEARLKKIFSGVADVYVTGTVDIGARNIWGLMKSLSQSYMLAFVIIALLMILLIGSLRIGLISMIPNFLPILVTLGLMGFVGIPMTLFTVLLGGIALGLAVDDTIHFLHNFKRRFDESGSIVDSVRDTVQTTGRALFFTTMVMSIGFFSYLVADMNVLLTFGFVVGFTVILAFLADLIVTPALISLVYRNKEKSGLSQNSDPQPYPIRGGSRWTGS